MSMQSIGEHRLPAAQSCGPCLVVGTWIDEAVERKPELAGRASRSFGQMGEGEPEQPHRLARRMGGLEKMAAEASEGRLATRRMREGMLAGVHAEVRMLDLQRDGAAFQPSFFNAPMQAGEHLVKALVKLVDFLSGGRKGLLGPDGLSFPVRIHGTAVVPVRHAVEEESLPAELPVEEGAVGGLQVRTRFDSE
jgi:hypothetical protein